MKKIILIILLFLGFASLSYSEEPRQTLITEIRVNGAKFALKDTSDFVIAFGDSLNVSYGCKQDTDKDKWLFRVKLRKGEDENTTTVQSAQIAYNNLQEGDYLIMIEAFRPSKWTASKAYLKFRVNTKEAEIKKKIITQKIEESKQDSIKNAEINAKNASKFSEYVHYIIIGVVILIFITIIVVTLIILKNKNSSNKTKTIRASSTMNENTDNRSKEEVLLENDSLRAEIAALREQIDAMQSRGSELNEKNKELEERVSKVSDSKKELEDLQKQKDELFAMIIHDIKNPASLIKGLVELLRSYDLNAVETQEIIDDIVETTEKIVSLSQEVSKILTLESSAFHLNIEQGQISEVISSVYRRNLPGAQVKSIQMFLEINDNLPEAVFDPQRIEEVMDNLVSNSVKFSHKGGTVRIRAYAVENNIVIETSDNGLGLSEEDIKKAFMRGAKLSARPTAGEPSSGLGLWIVKKIIDAHKGRVWVRSALGKGSTFSFSIPLDPEKK